MPMPRKGSRLLTEKVQDQICDFIRVGNYAETAALLAGVRPWNYHNWMEKGRREISEQDDEGSYAGFVIAVREAEAQAQALALDCIRKAAFGGLVTNRTTVTKADGSTVVTETLSRGEWTAAAWYLERKYPDLFGRRDRLDLTVRQEAEKIARDLGVDVETFLAEAQRIHEERAKG